MEQGQTQGSQGMVCESHKATYAIVFITGLLIGILATWGYSKYRTVPYGASPVLPQGMMMPAVMTDIRTVSGKVDSISGDKITFTGISTDMSKGQVNETRTAIVDSTTRIVRVIQRDPREIQKETDDFMKKMGSASQKPGISPMMPPSPVKMQEIKLADIKAGDQIIVTAKENIKDKKEFTATDIQVQ